MPSVIAGTGVARPPNVVKNEALARVMETTDEWIRTRTGVTERRFVDPGIGSSDLAVQAGREAIAGAGLGPADVDVLVTATMTPDFQNPGIAGLVQHGLGLRRVPTFDLRQQCCGFLYGLDLADALIETRRAATVLVIGAEVHAGYLPIDTAWDVVLGREDRDATEEERAMAAPGRTWGVIFGDGGGAIVVRRGGVAGEGIIARRLYTDGAFARLVTVPGLGSRRQPYADQAQIEAGLHLPEMDGGGLYRQAVHRMPEVILEVLGDARLAVADIDLVVAHQANERILEGVRQRLGVDASVVPSNIALWGNTTAATLPILFHELREAGRVRPGGLVCFVAFGAGAHWGAILYRVPR